LAQKLIVQGAMEQLANEQSLEGEVREEHSPEPDDGLPGMLVMVFFKLYNETLFI
jgi:hypothetical protein